MPLPDNTLSPHMTIFFFNLKEFFYKNGIPTKRLLKFLYLFMDTKKLVCNGEDDISSSNIPTTPMKKKNCLYLSGQSDTFKTG